jgi:hypothetical protein
VSNVKLYDCHNKPNLHHSNNGYWAKNGLVFVHEHCNEDDYCHADYSMVWVKNTMSRECRYDCKKTDARCEGCER